ncbi:heme oxygenase [Synechococcus sp. PCC 7502]|uniref:biliverdin-producing heme oxygenase n=1 Tax=Synechococcus sp. PCC 7502 TaxID=1173263 RepID=UPI00029FC40B|nr:biliverdin-producing heme oxygenase [Synechococcus sp. PCC 7502]AFY72527.1 heme oxygenase [Synechococcus sp. PCC 7502]
MSSNLNSGLAAKLRDGTAKSHSMAEGADFIKCFLQGVIDKESYRKLAANFYFVYTALEAELTRHKDHPVLSSLYTPDLWREKSLEQDLAYYYGTDWRNLAQPSEACKKYVKHIQAVSNNTPELLAAHAYTRYMGDLSGGQILKKIAKQAMGLKDGNGTAFYEFPTIKNHGEYKKKYRALLDTLSVDDATQDKIVDEANYAFHLNMEMFQELKGNWFITLWQMFWNWVLSRFQPSSATISESTPA